MWRSETMRRAAIHAKKLCDRFGDAWTTPSSPPIPFSQKDESKLSVPSDEIKTL